MYVVRHRAMPVGAQVKEHLKYQVATGAFRPGKRLPSIRRLERELRVNRNTVLKVLRELAEEGVLGRRPRSGFYANALAASPRAGARRRALRRLTVQFPGWVRPLGLPPLFAARAVARELQRQAAARPFIGYVECTPDQLELQGQFLERALDTAVRPYLASDLLRGRAALDPAITVLIASRFHYAEIRRRFGTRRRLQVVPVTTRPTRVFFQGLAGMSPRARVVILEPASLPNREFSRGLEAVLPPAWQRRVVDLAALPRRAVFPGAQAIFYAPRDRQAVLQRCVQTARLREVVFQIDRESLARALLDIGCV